MTLEVWNKIHDHDFLGLTFPFGSLVHYKTERSKLETWCERHHQGWVLGWRLESGVNWKGVYKVADLTNVSGVVVRESIFNNHHHNDSCCSTKMVLRFL